MIDPLADVVTLLQPAARYSKVVTGGGAWRVRRAVADQPLYCVVIRGRSRLTIDGLEPLMLAEGDFVLVPAPRTSVMSSVATVPPDDMETIPEMIGRGEFRVGDEDAPTDVQFLLGHCEFGAPDAALLVSLLPRLIHVRDEARLTTLVRLAADESRASRPGRDVILGHLLEVLLIEALRSVPDTAASPGLLRGLADPRLAAAIRRMHEDPARAWTVAQLAGEASLSRSAFFERFSRSVGMAPMEYLLTWRMALAKKLLQQAAHGVTEVAGRVGYSSASTFTVAFTRHVGMPPARYARGQALGQIA